MISLPKPQKFASRLASIEKISSKVYLERFALVEPKEITFLAGQTVMLYVVPGSNRSMSIASPPSEKQEILLAHDISPMGPYSQWAIGAKAGDPMQFMGPLGIFVVDKQSPRKKIFVATGSGIAPFRSMILDDPSNTVLYWGLRHEEDVFWQNEFSRIPFHLILSQPGSAWTGETGHVQEHVFSQEKDIQNCDVYLCGNRQMVEEMKARLSAAGVPAAQVKSELFY